MADKGNRGASGSWEEELFKGFNTPVSLLSANPSEDTPVGRDELGREIFETIEGERYMVGEVKAPASISETAKKVAKAVPPMEDWRLPTKEEVGKGLKEGGKAVAEGLWDVVKTPTNPDATLGDMFDVGGAMAAPGASKVLDKVDPSKLNIFYTPRKDTVTKAKELEDLGATREEIAETLGVWKDRKGNWFAETDDSSFDINPLLTSEVDAAGSGMGGPFEKAIPHEELYRKFPELRDREFNMFPTGELERKYGKGVLGLHFPDDGQIMVDRIANRGVAIHELQHAVDTLEKRDAGASPSKVWADITAIYEDLPTESKTILGMLASKDRLSKELPVVQKQIERFKEVDEKDAQSFGVWTTGTTMRPLSSVREVAAEIKETLDALDKQLGLTKQESADHFNVSEKLFKIAKTNKMSDDAAYQAYLRNEGELRADLADQRKDLTRKQRRQIDPFPEMKDDWTQKELTAAIKDARDLIDTNNGFISYKDELMSLSKPKFAEGGVVTDPNEVPPGALPEEVADGVDIKASQGEYIIPANVVRFLGLDKLEKMVEQAKTKLGEMESKGRMGNNPDDELPFTQEELMASDPAPQEQAPQAAPAFAEGGLVMGIDPSKDPNSTETDPVTGLPLWMTNLQRGTASPSTPAVAQPAAWRPSNGQQERDSKAGEYGTELTGMAQSVHKWSPKEFNTYAKARNSVEQKVGQTLASAIPFGGLAVRAREKYLERNVPRSMEQMLEDKVDLQGNPLNKNQLKELQESYNQITGQALDKGFGYSRVAKKVAEDAGIINRKNDPEKAKAQQKKNQEDSLINRVMDALTKDRSVKDSSKKDTNKSSKSESSRSERSDRSSVGSKSSGSSKSSRSSSSSRSSGSSGSSRSSGGSRSSGSSYSNNNKNAQ